MAAILFSILALLVIVVYALLKRLTTRASVQKLGLFLASATAVLIVLAWIGNTPSQVKASAARSDKASTDAHNAEIEAANAAGKATREKDNASKEAASQAATNSAIAGAESLKAAMRNPASFKLIEVSVMGNGAVCCGYRAQNGFGGLNVEHALLSPDGFIRSENASGFTRLWNKHCAGKAGADETWVVGRMSGSS
jgi:hypothetical protein